MLYDRSVLHIFDLDYQLFTFFNSLTLHVVWFDAVTIFAADYIIFLMIALIVGYVWFERDQDKGFAHVAHMMTAMLLSRGVFVELIRIFLTRSRPFTTSDAVIQLLAQNPVESSFPSAHASLMFALAMSMYYANRKWGVAFFIFAIISSLSRVIVGVHYPLDIIAGAVVGIGAAILVEVVAKRFGKGKK